MAENNNQGGFDWIIDQIAGDTYANLGFESSKYDFTYRVFPENLGNEENSHYMILNINYNLKCMIIKIYKYVKGRIYIYSKF